MAELEYKSSFPVNWFFSLKLFFIILRIVWLTCELSYYFCIKAPWYVNKSNSFHPLLSLCFSVYSCFDRPHSISLLLCETKPNLSELKKVPQFVSNPQHRIVYQKSPSSFQLKLMSNWGKHLAEACVPWLLAGGPCPYWTHRPELSLRRYHGEEPLWT